MVRTRSKPAHYAALPFHAIRFSSFLSASIVSGILIYFCYQLKHDGYKIPWTFLVVIAASLLNLLALILTLIIHSCGTLSPLFSLITNVPLLVFWILGLSLLSWNMYGTLAHTCTIANWASSDGVMICQIYKALFSFTVIGTLSQLAQVVLDGKARRTQTRLGKYDKMGETETTDMKMEPIPIINEPVMYEDTISPHQQQFQDEQRYRDEAPGWRPGVRNSNAPGAMDSRGSMTMNQFAYQPPVQQTTYDSGGYMHHESNRFYQQQ